MNNMSEQSERDREQDEMISRNAESIRRNEEAILRQTKALEQIRDHYFPKRTLWSQLCGLFLKAVELDGDTLEYRIRLEYVKAMVGSKY